MAPDPSAVADVERIRAERRKHLTEADLERIAESVRNAPKMTEQQADRLRRLFSPPRPVAPS